MTGGARIDQRTLLSAYAQGIFPMADSAEDDSVFWVEPRHRAIIPLDTFAPSRRLRRTIASDRFRVTADQAFERIVDLCAEAAADRPSTWINGVIRDSYADLHRIGHAHSIECWDGDTLVGGLYGVSLGRAFFGESMVSRARDASKVALAHLVARLRVGRFTLLDCQFMTEHLRSLGAVEMTQRAYLRLLQPAVSGVAAAGAAGAGGGVGAGAGSGRGSAAGVAGRSAAGAGDAAGFAAAGVVEIAGRAGAAAAGAAADGIDAGPDWGELDRLVSLLAPGGRPDGSAFAPGKLIVQLLTNTS